MKIEPEELQKEMHDFIKALINGNKKISYQDAANTFFILKICELENKIEQILPTTT